MRKNNPFLILTLACYMFVVGCEVEPKNNLAYYIEHPKELQTDLLYCKNNDNIKSEFCMNVFKQNKRYKKYKEKYQQKTHTKLMLSNPAKSTNNKVKINPWLELDD